LTKLVQNGVLLKQERRYMISSYWLDEVVEFSRFVKSRYEKKIQAATPKAAFLPT
jgi:heme-degrading monooxygenase HmoA